LAAIILLMGMRALAGDGFKLSITACENAVAVSRQKTMALFGFWVHAGRRVIVCGGPN